MSKKNVKADTEQAVVEPVSDAKAEEFKERAEADFDPVETAVDRLARLDVETKAAMKAARKEVRDEKKQASKEIADKVIAPELAKIAEILVGIETASGKIFRTFSYVYKFGKYDEFPQLKVRYSLITPRGESTADDTDSEDNSEES